MGIKYEIIQYGISTVHSEGIGDSSLCAHDLSGDDVEGWEMAEQTNKKINCDKCIMLIEIAKSQKKRLLAAL